MNLYNFGPNIYQENTTIKFLFKEILTYQDACQAVEKWTQIFKSNPETKFDLIFNAKQMEDYEPKARSLWAQTIKEYKSQIKSIWVVTDSRFITIGAMVLSTVSTFRINIVDAENQISLEQHQNNKKGIT